MVRAVERKVRSRAKQIYESRGQGEGQELQDWFQAESEVLDKTIIASLYRRLTKSGQEPIEDRSATELVPEQPAGCETTA